MSEAAGVLAIFNNVAPGREAEFNAWFQHEHLAERIAVPGFLLGRRYEAVSGDRRYFNYYLTQSPDVLTSAAYLARVNDPTPMTRMVMSEIFRDMIRTVCRRTYKCGDVRGAAAAVVRFDRRPNEAALRDLVETLVRDDTVACGEVWMGAHPPALVQTEEERLRGGDRRIEACLLIETLRADDATRIAASLAASFTGAVVGVYRLLCDVRSASAQPI